MKLCNFLVFCCLLLSYAGAEERVYTNRQGQKIAAEVETVRSGKVFLKMKGKRFAVPFADLSADDQVYLREWVKSNFNYRFTYTVKKHENRNPQSGGQLIPAPNGGKMVHNKPSSWKYNVDIYNQSGIDVANLRVEYRIYVRNTSVRDPTYGKKSKRESATVIKGSATLGNIDNSKKAVFQTGSISTLDQKWKEYRTRRVTDSDGYVTIEKYWDNYEKEIKLDGIWIRIFREDKMIHEYKSDGKMIKDGTWN